MEQFVLFIMLLFTAYAGLWAHWWKKHYRLQTASDFWGYIESHPKHSRRAVTGVFAAVVVFFQLGDVVLSGQWLANAFMAGYALDSALNKSKEQT